MYYMGDYVLANTWSLKYYWSIIYLITMSNCLGNTKENSLLNFFLISRTAEIELKPFVLNNILLLCSPSKFSEFPLTLYTVQKDKVHTFLNNQPMQWSRKNIFEIPPCAHHVIFITEYVLLIKI